MSLAKTKIYQQSVRNRLNALVLHCIDSSKAGISGNIDDLPEVSLEEMLDDLNLEDVDM